ncbi:hypothetical protein [Edaphobacter aggregans]|uniref:hypothetical protein n=1 Tax=Edaphobacter aggregans TaxID=570835 RepID=UPI000F74304A|nr:hypothetical protein [Edaphobacter aggregans]
MNDLLPIRTRDRHRATLFSGFDLDGVFPTNALVFPQPGDLLGSIARHNSRLLGTKYRKDSGKRRNHRL